MKLYHWSVAPNPRRVRMFLAEKDISVPMEDVGQDANLRPEYAEKFGRALVPMLELDNGACIWEAMAICRYFEDLYPDPRLMGKDAADKAIVEMWERRAYEEGLLGAVEVFRNSHPAFKDRGLAGSSEPVPQIVDLVERGRGRLRRFYRQMEHQLATNEFVTGPQYSVADITTLCAIDFAKWTNNGIPPECVNLSRWYDLVSARSSATA
jgi:glutathione S-transferase